MRWLTLFVENRMHASTSAEPDNTSCFFSDFCSFSMWIYSSEEACGNIFHTQICQTKAPWIRPLWLHVSTVGCFLGTLTKVYEYGSHEVIYCSCFEDFFEETTILNCKNSPEKLLNLIRIGHSWNSVLTLKMLMKFISLEAIVLTSFRSYFNKKLLWRITYDINPKSK